MDLDELYYADMDFTHYEDGFFYFKGTHEGCVIYAKFKPNKNFKDRISATENFGEMGWECVKITDENGKILHESS